MEPVFADRTGRRRRLFTALGAALGVLLVAGLALMTAGLMGSSPVPLPGLPNNGQGVLERGDAERGDPSPGPAPQTKPATARPTPTSAAPLTAVTVAAAASTAADKNPHRPSHPVNPKSSRTR